MRGADARVGLGEGVVNAALRARARSAAVLRFGKHMHASTTTTATVSEESRESEEEDTRNALGPLPLPHPARHLPDLGVAHHADAVDRAGDVPGAAADDELLGILDADART